LKGRTLPNPALVSISGRQHAACSGSHALAGFM
jgi:hypothetical protein